MFPYEYVEKIKNGYRLKRNIPFLSDVIGYHITTERMILRSTGGGILYAGFTWDGATKAPDIDSVIIPSAIHDALYSLIRAKKIGISEKIYADSTFYKYCRSYGTPYIIAKIYFYGVKIFGFVGLKGK